VKIYPDVRYVVLDGKDMSFDDMVRFAKRDGFKNVYDFLDFFRRYSYEVREYGLEVIYWRLDPHPQPFPLNGGREQEVSDEA